MMAIDLPPALDLWTPPKPAIIRHADALILPQHAEMKRRALLDGAPFIKKHRPYIADIGAAALGSGDSVSVSPPANARQGDILLCVISTENGGITAPGDSFSELASSPQGNGVFAASTRLSVYGKVRGSTQSAVTCGLFGSHTVAIMLAIRRASITPNASAGSNGGSSTSVSIPTVTTTKAWCLVLNMVAFSVNTTVGSWSNSNIYDFKEIVDIATTDDDDGGLAIAAGYKAVAGATGATTATLANASSQGRLTYAFEFA